MSDDPETVRQIAELALDDRPLLVLDVDDVLLEFVRPFPKYLETRGFGLKMASFKLTGNIYEMASGRLPEQAEVGELLGSFFDVQADWQTLTEGAADAMAGFGNRVEIVLLTAMPHRHREIRRAHLDRLGLTYPLVTTEMAKGPALRSLRGASGRPVAFVDDLPPNLVSARQSVPDAHIFHLMADNSLRALLPPAPEDVVVVENWAEAAAKIATALRV
ncbi:MAG: hypothetical protein AB7S80_02045 [Rhizobiaceae bacterium]